MGTSASKDAGGAPERGPSAPAESGCGSGSSGDAFDAKDLMRHLQEIEGYEVYDVFECARGSRMPAPVRIWLEAVEECSLGCSAASHEAPGAGACAGAAGSGGDAEGLAAAQEARCRGLGARAGAGAALGFVQADPEPWVVLSSAPSQPRPQLSGHAKGRGPPPPKARGKAPALAKAKAGPGPPPKKAAAPPPPPFGKRLHWKLLPPAALGDTIFEELRPWGEAPPIDTGQLERLFAPPVPPPRERSAAGLGVSGASGAPDAAGGGGLTVRRHSACGPLTPGRGSHAEVQLLDPKRAQNLAIVLRQVAIPTEELSEVLRWMRLSHPVTVDALEHVNDNLLPPLLESAELLRYDGPPEALRSLERQLLPLAKLPRLKARLQIMLFSKSLPSTHGSLLSRIRALKGACAEVRSSGALKQVFGTVLRVGNYLNHGVDAPDAGGGVEVRGFTVESLLKLRDFRAAQGGEVSALHCVVLHLLPGHPQLLAQLRGELRAVLDAGEGAGFAGVCIADLRDAVYRFQSETDLVQGEMERFADCYRSESGAAEGPGPLAALERLVEDAGELAHCLQEALREAQADAWRLLEYFGEQRRSCSESTATPPGSWDDEAYTSVERFFATIREFVVSFEECWREALEQPRRLRLESTAGHLSSGPTAPAGPGSRIVQLGPGGTAHSNAAAVAAAAAMAAVAAAAARGEPPSRPGSPASSARSGGVAAPGELTARRSSASLAAEAAAAVRRRNNRALRAATDGGAAGAARGEAAEVD